MKTLTKEQKEANRKERERIKERAVILAEMTQPEIKELNIVIEWKKSRTWGNCPRAYVEVSRKDGTFYRSDPSYYASGCGYCKESTVIAEIFNDYLKYKLWRLLPEQAKGGHGSLDNGPAPYGINIRNYDDIERRYFAGGIGVNCYYQISEYIGGKFECIASGKSFDVYKYTDSK